MNIDTLLAGNFTRKLSHVYYLNFNICTELLFLYRMNLNKIHLYNIYIVLV